METSYFRGHFSYVFFRMTTFLAFYFSATRNLTFETLKIGTNNPEIANLKFENHGFLKNHVCLPNRTSWDIERYVLACSVGRNILYKKPIAMQVWLIISCKLIMKPYFDFHSLGREVKLEQTLWQAWESFNLLGSLGDADGGGDLDKAARYQLKQQIQNYKQESSILISCNWTFSLPYFFMFSLCRNVVMVVNIEDQIRKTAHYCTA